MDQSKDVVTRFSIFEFEEEPTLFPAFLHTCTLAGKKVYFANEDERFGYGDPMESVRIAAWVIVLTVIGLRVEQYAEFQKGKDTHRVVGHLCDLDPYDH